MLGLLASAEVRQALRNLRTANPELFNLVTERIGEIRQGDGPVHRLGRSFHIEGVGLARLITFYDFEAGTDLAVVWLPDASTDPPAVKLIAVEHTD